jgi:hypothetical protein
VDTDSDRKKLAGVELLKTDLRMKDLGILDDVNVFLRYVGYLKLESKKMKKTLSNRTMGLVLTIGLN